MSLALRLKGRSGRGGGGGARARGTDGSQVCSRRLAWPGLQPPVRDRVPRPARSLLTERGVARGGCRPLRATRSRAGAASGRGDRTAVTTVPARTVSLPACLRAPRIQRGDGVHACDDSGQLSNAALSPGLTKSDVYDQSSRSRGSGTRVVPRGGRGPRAHGGRPRPSHEDAAQGPSRCPCSGFVLSHREVPGDLLI